MDFTGVSRRLRKDVSRLYKVAGMNKSRSVAVFAMIVISGCGLATLFSFLGRFGWFFDLFSHFHLQYAWALGVVVVILALLRQWWPLAAALLLLSPHLVCLSYYAPVRTAVPAGDSAALQVVAFNVLRSNQRYEEVLGFLQESDADILLLVEVDEDWLAALRPLEKSHPHFRQIARSDNFGMAVYSRFPIRSHDETAVVPGQLPCMVTRIDWDGRPLTVIGAHPYPPIGGSGARIRDEYLAQLGTLARQASADSEVIVLGDFNTTPWAHGFRDLLESGSLLDSGKYRGFHSTWKRRNPVFSLPLDHVLHSAGLETLDRWVGPDLGSDHRPVGGSLRRRVGE